MSLTFTIAAIAFVVAALGAIQARLNAMSLWPGNISFRRDAINHGVGFDAFESFAPATGFETQAEAGLLRATIISKSPA